MDFEESEDGDALRIHPSHYLHWHEHGPETPAFAALKPCMRIGDAVFGGDGVNSPEYLEAVVLSFSAVRGSQVDGRVPSSWINGTKEIVVGIQKPSFDFEGYCAILIIWLFLKCFAKLRGFFGFLFEFLPSNTCKNSRKLWQFLCESYGWDIYIVVVFWISFSSLSSRGNHVFPRFDGEPVWSYSCFVTMIYSFCSDCFVIFISVVCSFGLLLALLSRMTMNSLFLVLLSESGLIRLAFEYEDHQLYSDSIFWGLHLTKISRWFINSCASWMSPSILHLRCF